MNRQRVVFRGILPPLTTPFAADGSVDLKGLAANVEKYNRTGLAGYVVVGSTGESVALRGAEKCKIWETVRAAADSGKLLVAGTGCEATGETIELSKQAGEFGYHAVLVRTPSYFKSQMSDTALERHFFAVAEASPLPVLVYSVPQFTGLPVTAGLVARLAEHPNIIGIKESSGNVQLVADILRRSPPDFQVLVGSATTLYPSLVLGACAAILAVACALPEVCVELYQAVTGGDHERARRVQRLLHEPAVAVTSRYGVGGLKFAMELGGYVGGLPRPPLLSPDESARAEIARIFEAITAST